MVLFSSLFSMFFFLLINFFIFSSTILVWKLLFMSMSFWSHIRYLSNSLWIIFYIMQGTRSGNLDIVLYQSFFCIFLFLLCRCCCLREHLKMAVYWVFISYKFKFSYNFKSFFQDINLVFWGFFKEDIINISCVGIGLMFEFWRMMFSKRLPIAIPSICLNNLPYVVKNCMPIIF